MEENKEKIHKYNIFYKILRFLVMFGIRNFYKRIEIVGNEKIPYGSCFIITPNHQNALMDAMAVLFSVKKNDIVFMTRADIFKKRSQEKILTFLKMLPIYRIRDGVQELAKNEEIFERSLNILKERIPICLMPEGNHGDKRRLRNFVKGAFRIAFRAQENLGNKESVKILPFGLDYQHYQKYKQDLLIIFGDPVDVLEYMDDYRENQAKGLNLLRDRVSKEMKKVMIHIENDELYDMFQDLRHIWNSRMREMAGIRGKKLFDKFRADKIMIDILNNKYETDPDYLRQLALKTSGYMKNLSLLNMRNRVIEKQAYSFIKFLLIFTALFITFPIALYGYFNNFLPFNIPVIKTRKVKDKQFHSSFKFVFSLLMFPAFYIAQSLVVRLLTGSALIAWFYFFSLPLTGYIALYWSFYFKKLRSAFFFRKGILKNDPLLNMALKQHSEIIDTMRIICKDYFDKIPMHEKKLIYV